MTRPTLREFLRFSHPLMLLGGLLTYALGVGIAHYLGASIRWNLYFLGQAWVLVMQLTVHWFGRYFDPTLRTRLSQDDESPLRDALLWGGFAALAAALSFAFMLRTAGADAAAILLMLLTFALGLLFAVPPVRLAETGYGELALAILLAALIPALAFALQFGELHRLVAMSTFPLLLLSLAMLLALDFPTYARDLKRERGTLLLRLGWQHGMFVHNFLILMAYVLIGVAMLFGFPAAIGLPALLSLPLGLFQVWYMTRIAAGAKPNWRALGWLAIATFGTTAYLLAFSFWTR